MSESPELIRCSVCGEGVYHLAYGCPRCDAPRGVFDVPQSVRIKAAQDKAAGDEAAKLTEKEKTLQAQLAATRQKRLAARRRLRKRGIAVALLIVYVYLLFLSIS